MSNAAMQHLHGNMPRNQATVPKLRDEAGEALRIAQFMAPLGRAVSEKWFLEAGDRGQAWRMTGNRAAGRGGPIRDSGVPGQRIGP
jgi:hypothetical protein